MEHLSNDHKDGPNWYANSHRLCEETEHPVFSWCKSMETETRTWLESGSESHCRTNTSIRRKKEIPKSRTVRVTFRDASRKVSHQNKVIWDCDSLPNLSVPPE